eukprot:7881117-Heterocapsa_arctica.AAC.1
MNNAYTDFALESRYIQAAWAGTNFNHIKIVYTIRGSHNSVGAVLGRLVRLMLAAGLNIYIPQYGSKDRTSMPDGRLEVFISLDAITSVTA